MSSRFSSENDRKEFIICINCCEKVNIESLFRSCVQMWRTLSYIKWKFIFRIDSSRKKYLGSYITITAVIWNSIPITQRRCQFEAQNLAYVFSYLSSISQHISPRTTLPMPKINISKTVSMLIRTLSIHWIYSYV